MKRNRWTVAKIVKCASRCKTRHEFKYRYQPAYNRALKLDMLDDLFGPKRTTKSKQAVGPNRYWTTERLKKIAAKYKTRKSFRFHQPSAYMAAYMYNVLEEICAHMPKRIPWVKRRPNVGLIFKAASETNTLVGFKRRYCGAYINAHRYGLLAEILDEMKARKQREKESVDGTP